VARGPTVGRVARGLDVRQEINDGIRTFEVGQAFNSHIAHIYPTQSPCFRGMVPLRMSSSGWTVGSRVYRPSLPPPLPCKVPYRYVFFGSL